MQVVAEEQGGGCGGGGGDGVGVVVLPGADVGEDSFSAGVGEVRVGGEVEAGLLGVGVGSGVATGGSGVDFRTRRPDCATTANAHNPSSVRKNTA